MNILPREQGDAVSLYEVRAKEISEQTERERTRQVTPVPDDTIIGNELQGRKRSELPKEKSAETTNEDVNATENSGAGQAARTGAHGEDVDDTADPEKLRDNSVKIGNSTVINVEIRRPAGYTPPDMTKKETAKDSTEDDLPRREIIALVQHIPSAHLPAFKQVTVDFIAAGYTTMDYAPKKTEPDAVPAAAAEVATPKKKERGLDDWIKTRKPYGNTAEVLAAFIRDKFADELANRTMTTNELNRYEGLHPAFYTHRDKLPAELRDIPTISELNDRQVAEGKVLPLRPEVRRTLEKELIQVRRAQQRGVIVPT